MHWKSFGLGVLSLYVIAAIFSGISMSRAVPALNGLGTFYVGATWGGAMFCAATQNCTVLPPSGSPLANALFTFSE